MKILPISSYKGRSIESALAAARQVLDPNGTHVTTSNNHDNNINTALSSHGNNHDDEYNHQNVPNNAYSTHSSTSTSTSHIQQQYSKQQQQRKMFDDDFSSPSEYGTYAYTGSNSGLSPTIQTLSPLTSSSITSNNNNNIIIAVDPSSKCSKHGLSACILCKMFGSSPSKLPSAIYGNLVTKKANSQDAHCNSYSTHSNGAYSSGVSSTGGYPGDEEQEADNNYFSSSYNNNTNIINSRKNLLNNEKEENYSNSHLSLQMQMGGGQGQGQYQMYGNYESGTSSSSSLSQSFSLLPPRNPGFVGKSSSNNSNVYSSSPRVGSIISSNNNGQQFAGPCNAHGVHDCLLCSMRASGKLLQRNNTSDNNNSIDYYSSNSAY